MKERWILSYRGNKGRIGEDKLRKRRETEKGRKEENKRDKGKVREGTQLLHRN